MEGQNLKLKAQSCSLKFKTEMDRRAYILSLEMIDILKNIDFRNRAAEIIAKQLLRSITSICANMLEARGGSSRKDFINYYQYALKSANESKYWIAVLIDSQVYRHDLLTTVLKETDEIANMLASSILTLKGKNQF